MQFLSTIDPTFSAQFTALLAQARETTQRVDTAVRDIITDVRARGDAALCDYTARFDGFTLSVDQLRVSTQEIDDAVRAIPLLLMAALEQAARRIEAFHQLQRPSDIETTDAEGIRMGLRWRALDSVGLYVPGGKAAYPSSVLMNAIPARVAGVERIAMCVPCRDGVVPSLVLAAARLAGVSEIFRIGGAQAVAALAYGTEHVAAVDRIVGPGNAYVAEAKRQVFGQVGIDGIAGPSEVVILADATQNPGDVAWDLLAHAEHDEDAQAILITDSTEFAKSVAAEVDAAIPRLARSAIARASWQDHGAIVIVQGWDEATELVNRLAPEHLQIMTAAPDDLFARIRHAGAAFLGAFAPEALGDYVAGPNHVLPTGRTARYASGLSVYDFLKRTSFLAAGPAALAAVGPAAVRLAEAEGLGAHAHSIQRRLDRGARDPHFSPR